MPFPEDYLDKCSEIHDLKLEIDRLKIINQQLRLKDEAMGGRLEQSERQQVQQRVEMERITANHTNLQLHAQTMSDCIRDLRGKLDQAYQEIKYLDSQLMQLTGENRSLKQLIEDDRRNLSSMKEENMRLSLEHDESRELGERVEEWQRMMQGQKMFWKERLEKVEKAKQHETARCEMALAMQDMYKKENKHLQAKLDKQHRELAILWSPLSENAKRDGLICENKGKHGAKTKKSRFTKEKCVQCYKCLYVKGEGQSGNGQGLEPDSANQGAIAPAHGGTDTCYYHTVPPMSFSKWRRVGTLQEEASDPKYQSYSYFMCCNKLSRHAPRGCAVGKHDFTPRRDEDLS